MRPSTKKDCFTRKKDRSINASGQRNLNQLCMPQYYFFLLVWHSSSRGRRGMKWQLELVTSRQGAQRISHSTQFLVLRFPDGWLHIWVQILNFFSKSLFEPWPVDSAMSSIHSLPHIFTNNSLLGKEREDEEKI